MTDDAFPLDGMLPLDPSPDEDAWEAYLEFALERLDGDDSAGLRLDRLADLESACGTQLPYEIGLLLVMGVPNDDGWRTWGEDPASELAEWNDQLLQGVLTDVVETDRWPEAWGARPATPDARTDRATEMFAAAPQLLPIYKNCAVAVTAANGEAAAESNPILAIAAASVTVRGSDLAAWLHHDFDVPLPMWPETPERIFPFWSELS